jgi:small subunit ribosomal protein S6
MREYEVVLIALADLDETNLNTMVDKVKAWITTAGGTVSKVDKWGKRRLTFAIRKQREGQYVLIKAEMDPKFTSELERNLRFLEPVMRFMISSVETLD